MGFRIAPGLPVLLPVQVHGPMEVRRVWGMLDTGASVMTIPPQDAAILGYDVDAAPTVSIVTAGGAAAAPRIVLRRVVVAGYRVENVPALCVELSMTRASALLGLSLLSRLDFSFDHKAGRLTITDP